VNGNTAYSSATDTHSKVSNMFCSSGILLIKLEQFLWRKSVYLLYVKNQEADCKVESKLAGTQSPSYSGKAGKKHRNYAYGYQSGTES